MFNLRFDPHEIPYWAGRYHYPADTPITHKIAPRIQEQGFCTAVILTFYEPDEWFFPGDGKVDSSVESDAPGCRHLL